MNNDIALDAYTLEPYFRHKNYKDDKYTVEIGLFNDSGRYGFTVKMEMREPSYVGAYPRQGYRLEQHTGKGHAGTHIQVSYRKVSDKTTIREMRIMLEVDNEKEMQALAKGFVYTHSTKCCSHSDRTSNLS